MWYGRLRDKPRQLSLIPNILVLITTWQFHIIKSVRVRKCKKIARSKRN